jgi:hypothetical protein
MRQGPPPPRLTRLAAATVVAGYPTALRWDQPAWVLISGEPRSSASRRGRETRAERGREICAPVRGRSPVPRDRANFETVRISRPRAGVQQFSKFARPALENRAFLELLDRYPRFFARGATNPRRELNPLVGPDQNPIAATSRRTPDDAWVTELKAGVMKHNARPKSRVKCLTQSQNSPDLCGKTDPFSRVVKPWRGPPAAGRSCVKTVGLSRFGVPGVAALYASIGRRRALR